MTRDDSMVPKSEKRMMSFVSVNDCGIFEIPLNDDDDDDDDRG